MESGDGDKTVDVVIPTAGGASLARLLAALAAQRDGLGRIFVVDDGGGRGAERAGAAGFAATLSTAGRRGPAAARNVGWRASRAPWIAFLDDDVVPPRDWARRLAADLRDPAPAVAASQGRIDVPLPPRHPTDWERNVAGLARAAWISADIAVRRSALDSVGGFDERFRRPYREDTDLALRLLGQGWQIVPGERRVEHPVPPAGFWISVERQRGNADDVLMRFLHGRHWRRWGRAPRGRLRRHLLASGLLGASLRAASAERRRAAAAFFAGWLGATAELAGARIAPGPRRPAEWARMLATSTVLPLAASAWWAWGLARLPLLLARGGPRGEGAGPPSPAPEAVLLDRDGTLLFDVAYNGDPAKVVPLPGAGRALRRLRASGLRLAVVSNQSGVARKLIDREQVEAVNRRAEELLGPVGPWLFCPHGPEDGCECRKPETGLIVAAAERLGVRPDRCLVIGDAAADVQAAQAAGAAAVLVPTPRTAAEDVRRAPLAAASIEAAVERLLGGSR